MKTYFKIITIVLLGTCFMLPAQNLSKIIAIKCHKEYISLLKMLGEGNSADKSFFITESGAEQNNFEIYKINAPFINEELIKEWENNDWENKVLQLYTYDQTGINTEYNTYNWKDKAWLHVAKSTITYNTDGMLIEALTKQWSPSTQTWNDYIRMEWKWLSANVPEETIMWFNYLGSWLGYRKLTYYYQQSEPSSVIITQEKLTRPDWENVSRDAFTYNDKKQMIEELSQKWENGGWVDNEKAVSTYDLNGYEVKKHKTLWKDGNWIDYLRFDYFYSSTGKKIREMVESWTNNAWENHTLETLKYDTQDRIEEKLEQNGKDAGWINDKLTLYRYGLPAGIKENPDKSLKYMVFPNPSNEFIFVNLPENNAVNVTVEVFSLCGKLLFQRTFAHEKFIVVPLNNFSNGCYMLTLRAENKNPESHKIIVIK